MLTVESIPDEELTRVKRKLNITWDDDETDDKVRDLMVDAEITLNHKLGAEMDYFSPGPARQLYQNLLLYMWSDSQDQFDAAYRSEILTVRHQNEVAAFAEVET
jgi:hypothetical protein